MIEELLIKNNQLAQINTQAQSIRSPFGV